MKPQIYLETTMFSFYYEERDISPYPALKSQVRQVFDRIQAGNFEPYTSGYTIAEIENNPNREKREAMRRLITEYGIKVLEPTEDTKRLPARYIGEGAIPASHPIDAAHIAITAVNGLDFIISLNFKHIARPWTVERVRRVNIQEGYNPIGIYKPAEVLEV